MSIKDSFNIEKYGMFRTILEYSTCNFINSYCEQLLKMTYPNDKEYIKLLTQRILSWYDEGNLEDIRIGEYVHSKPQHAKTYNLLKTYIEELSAE